jgi:TetR/AcrR family transcriptional regulator
MRAFAFHVVPQQNIAAYESQESRENALAKLSAPKVKSTRAGAQAETELKLKSASSGEVARQSRRGRPRNVSQAEESAARRRILDAALETFGTHGFEGTSIADIARLHQVSPALIHYYFDSKEELWRSAVNYGMGDVLHNLQATMDDLAEIDSISRLKFYIRRYIALHAERPEVFRVILRESETRGPRLAWLSKQHLTPLYKQFSSVIECAQAEGRIKPIAPTYHLAQIIAGASYQLIGSRNRMLETFGVDVLAKEVRVRHANAVIEILFNGMLTEPEAGGG